MPAYQPTREELEKIERLATIGLNRGEIASAIGHDRKWWYRQVENGNHWIVEAYAKGVAKHAASIMGSLYDVAVREKNVTALMFLAKCNLKRREKAPVKVDARQVNLNQGVHVHMSKEERLAQLQAITAELTNLIEADDDDADRGDAGPA